MKDFLGRTIREGDTVVYPGRTGSSLWMNRATVLAVAPGRLTVRLNKTSDGFGALRERTSTIRETSRVVVVSRVADPSEQQEAA